MRTRRSSLVVILLALLLVGGVSSAQDLWLWQPSLPATPRNAAVGFTLGNKGYVGLGANGATTLLNDLWQLNPDDLTWARKADFPGLARYAAMVFTIGYDAYVGGGYTTAGAAARDFWRYRSSTNTWTPVADFGGGDRYGGAAFDINGRGYIACGQGPTQMHNDLWEYDPALDAWTRKADMPAASRVYAVGLKTRWFPSPLGLVASGLGAGNAVFQDCWAYAVDTDSWARRADLPLPLYAAVGYSLPDTPWSLVGGGVERLPGPVFRSSTAFFEYFAYTDSWRSRADLYSAPGPGGNMSAVTYGAAFSINGKGYVVAGAEDQGPNTAYLREHGGPSLRLTARKHGTILDLVTWIGNPGVLATFRVGLPGANGGPPSSLMVLGTSPFDSLGRARLSRPIPAAFLSPYNIRRQIYVRAEANLPGLGTVRSYWVRISL